MSTRFYKEYLSTKQGNWVYTPGINYLKLRTNNIQTTRAITNKQTTNIE